MMMGDLSKNSVVELQLPINFVKEALIHIENDDKNSFAKRGIFTSFNQEVLVSFTKINSHLKVSFDTLQFSMLDGVHKCIIDSVDSTVYKEGLDDSTKSDHEINSSEVVVKDVKRKRGRPRKTKLIQKSDGKSNSHEVLKPTDNKGPENMLEEKDNVVVADLELDVLKKDLDNVNSDTTLRYEKRYSLRGKKLNSKIMAIEKGKGADINDSDGESVILSDSNSEEEVSRFKRKSQRKNLNDVASKENKMFLQKIKEKVKEILSKGAVSETIAKMKGKFIDCKICGMKLSGYTVAYKHLLKMHKKIDGLNDYLTEITKLKQSTCCFCGETFIDRSSLDNHKETVHKDVSFDCPLCSNKSKNLYSLKVHVRNMHVEVGKKAFCHLCSASFRSNGSLKQHIDLNHYGNKHVSCEICNKQFYNKSQLRRHMKAHGSDLSKRFKCGVCGKLFNFEFNLKRHINITHKPHTECFHCSYCGKGFSQKVPMITHVQRVHFNIFPYSCKECKNSFPKAPLLKEHMLSVHHIPDFVVPVVPKNSVYDKAEEDKFYCSYCSESFTHKIRLIEHMHCDHADAFPFKCDICIQGFLERSFLIFHMLKAHGLLIQNEDITQHSESAGEIMQIITTKNGYPSKVMSTESATEILTNNDETYQEELDDAANDGTVTMDAGSTDIVETVPLGSTQSSSLLVEVEQGSNTYQYVIEAPESLGQPGTEMAVEDIANLLIAAENIEKNGQEDQGEVLESESLSQQEISLIINENNQGHMEINENQAQTIEVLIDQNDQNTSLTLADNQAMEVVIDQNEQNREVFTIENPASSLPIEHGDIIEMNNSNSADGKNYYRIINVLDQ